MIRDRLGILALASSLVLLTSGGQALAGPTYNAVNDFSLASNPNGVWSYGSLSALGGGTFTAYTQTFVNGNYNGQNAWVNGQSFPNEGVVDKNTSGSTQSFLTIVQPTDVLRLDCGNGIADVRWTAPTAGAYDLGGFFERVDTGGYPVSVRVLLDGVALFSADNFTQYNAMQAFGLKNLTLKAGDTLDFALGAPQASYDSTGVSATITSSAASVPEPASVAMLVVGLAGALGYRSIRRKWCTPA